MAEPAERCLYMSMIDQSIGGADPDPDPDPDHSEITAEMRL